MARHTPMHLISQRQADALTASLHRKAARHGVQIKVLWVPTVLYLVFTLLRVL